MNKFNVQALMLGITGGIVPLVAIFISAGTINYWQGWLYGSVVIISLTAFNVSIAVHDPAAIRRRLQMGALHEQQTRQKIITSLGMPVLLAVFVLPALDHRFGWSPVPWYISTLGEVFVFLGLYVYYRVMRSNSFAASNIQVEEGQKVISTGPYAVVRHPMYAGACVFLVGTPLALGSLWTLLMTPVFFLVFVVRIRDEEKVLARDLTGYTEYKKKVRWRLFPGIF